ncbi:MAG: type II toxin-antitoxin system RelE/ParE family toxin [Pyrinomonadaceae bacterium]|nr:type II toxin-antitoxin system RelE/ParE family toxin [Pyrinomonadaceae bacterium]
MDERKLFAFTETVIFTEDLLEITDDATLYAIQNALLANPLLGDVIKNTSGARKGRIGNPKSKTGKSGGFRFIYVYLPKSGRFYLLSIYSKKDQSDLSPEQAKMLGEIVREIKKLYGEN